jgi:hypothetical protein
MRVLAVGVAKQDAERRMKVVNEYLAGKDGLTSGESLHRAVG